MQSEEHQEILTKLTDLFPGHIDSSKIIPQPYWNKENDVSKVKVIYLGCDPTNKAKNIQFEHAFAHGTSDPGFKRFITLHEKQLKSIGLSWDDVYTQNLCQNYFTEETAKNKIWKQAAEVMWIQVLNNELDSLFGKDIPVLLTSQLLLDVILNDDILENSKRPARYDAMKFYSGETIIPISSDQNKLGRPLIPLYRGRNPKTGQSYMLTNGNHTKYAFKIKQLLSTD
jgi:hypothetical protein